MIAMSALVAIDYSTLENPGRPDGHCVFAEHPCHVIVEGKFCALQDGHHTRFFKIMASDIKGTKSLPSCEHVPGWHSYVCALEVWDQFAIYCTITLICECLVCMG